MTRCNTMRTRMHARLALAAALSLPLLVLAPAALHAQETIRREAPKDVILGKMTVVAPPVIEMDAKPARLSPGSRIRDTRNMLVLSASLAGQTVPVVYRRDPSGLVHEVWLLNPDEYKQLSGISTGTAAGLQEFVNTLATVFVQRP